MSERKINRESRVYHAIWNRLAETPHWKGLSLQEQEDLADRAWLIAEHHPISFSVAQVMATEMADPTERQVRALESIAASLEKMVGHE